jgi:uncharacterized protein YkwD
MLSAVMSLVAGDAAAQTVSSGTAFSVAPEVLVTNHHVVKGCSSVEVISPDGRRTASIAAADADIDLAILRVSGLKGTTARLRDPTDVLLGESVLVFGYPLAGALSSGGNFTSGVVSALRGLGDSANQIQITSPVQPGNSGGPLMDSSGLVIGIIQGKLSLKAVKVLGDIPQNVNFAISLEALTQFLSKHKIDFQTMARSPALDTARVAEMAQKFTHRIECNVSEQRASNSDAPIVRAPPRPSSPRSPEIDAPWAASAVSMLSGYRTKNGLTPVAVDPELMKLANAQAQAMAMRDYLSHDLIGSFHDRLKGQGYHARIAAENVGAGYHTFEQAFSGWSSSPPHRANMLLNGATRMGIAAAYSPNSKYKVFWALIVAEPDERPAGVRRSDNEKR